VNYANFAGNIQPRDAVVKTLDSGQKVCNFTVAVSVGWGDNKKTLWVACAMWGDRGEKLAQYLTKGTAVAVAGDVDIRAFTSNGGEAKAELTLNVQRLTLQGGRNESKESRGGGERESAPSAPPSRQETPLGTGSDDFGDETLPF
jgi:single-strand DNA-binding protein